MAVPMIVAAEPEWPAPQPDAHHAVPAQPGALGGHPADGRLPGLVHGPHQQAERSQIVPRRRPSVEPVVNPGLGGSQALASHPHVLQDLRRSAAAVTYSSAASGMCC